MDADQQLRNVISDGGLLTAKSGILKRGWSEVTVKMLSDPERARRHLLREAEGYFLSHFGTESHISAVRELECLIISQQNSNKFMKPDNHREAEDVETSCHSH